MVHHDKKVGLKNQDSNDKYNEYYKAYMSSDAYLLGLKLNGYNNPEAERDARLQERQAVAQGDYQATLTDFKGWYGDYILSPTFRRRLESSGDYGSPEQIDEIIQLKFNALQNVTMKTFRDVGVSRMSVEDGKMNLYIDDDEPYNNLGTMAHEIGHAIGGYARDNTHEKNFSEKSDLEKRALSINDMQSLEDRNIAYQQAPYVPVKGERIYGLDYSKGTAGYEGDVVKDYNVHDTNLGTVRRGTPSTIAKKLIPTHFMGREVSWAKDPSISRDKRDYDSAEDYVRANYTFPEGYDEGAKEVEISRLTKEVEKDNARNTQIRETSNAYGKASKAIRKGSDRDDMGAEDIINWRVERDLEYAQRVVGNKKELKKKYRGMTLEEIPKGVNPDVDAYKESLALQQTLLTTQQARNDARNSSQGDTAPRPYTPEGGDALVIKRGGLHEIGATENYSDLVGVRAYLRTRYGIYPEDKITPEQYQMFLDDKEKPMGGIVLERFLRHYKPKDGLWELNNTARINPNKKGNGSLYGAMIES